MGWADRAIEKLVKGESAIVKPHGNSMMPKIKSGATVILAPARVRELKKGDIVLATVRGNQYLHLISAMDENRVQISNNKGYVNGWVSRGKVHGVAISIDNP